MNTKHIAKTLYEMTELLDDWDDDGGKAITKPLANRVEDFLSKMESLAKYWNREVPEPRLSPGPRETVDIHWEADGFELLINAKDDTGLCSYYGERPADSHVIKGSGYLSLSLGADLLRFILRMPIDR
jgi:hypothetical protein